MQLICDRRTIKEKNRGAIFTWLVLLAGSFSSVNAQTPATTDTGAPIKPLAQGTNQTAAGTRSIQMPTIVVEGNLDAQRQEIVPSLGATVYTIDQAQIQDFTQGNNISLSKLVLRLPGVSQDSEGSGSFHVRDEHANVQYRINDVLIPESITSFGSQFDTRFADRVDLITGALPVQYGFRESGILDIHTKSGAFDPGGEVETYGGSSGTLEPSFEYGGSTGKLNYYFSGSYRQDELGIENPTAAATALHDSTDQYRGFTYLSYILDENSRLSLLAGEAYNQFEIPNSPDQMPAVDGAGNPFIIPGAPTFNSNTLNERQREQNNFEVLAFQRSSDEFDFQVSLFNSYSAAVFSPDPLGDLYFNGVAGGLNRSVLSNGLQFDSSYRVSDYHTIRGGLLLNAQGASQIASTTVIPEDGSGAQDGLPETFHNRDFNTAYSYGFYLQDEWKISPQLTLNYGGRFDIYQSSQIEQNQLSPRLNGVYKMDQATSFHAGYASYFTPPPLENIPRGSADEFVGTSNAPALDVAGNPLPNGAVKSERANYIDLGITHNFTPEFQVGLDGYYKVSTNTLDDGQFGAAPIFKRF